ncbi:hypothetical protein PCIT_a2868 [Pseudoalteromonas citrea]|uniref:Large polyvalent protein-associated domain-containing protein n=2 Tax=Pseudoalteromonas citrea TaxID=43655 RepID=A0AAD4FRI8_9GAMM|nr:CLCA_X family protein [Pseudoalteromonas citrea]KAF7769943.1 hypothetical protein PCIT_a2868 [Pseudoalteromonas citrea]
MKVTRLSKGFRRNGPDYRFGDQVDFDEVRDTFGFCTISIGQWVTKSERYISANLIYDALADLAQILNIPPEAIGLRGTLNFSFGTGGQLGVQAHYNSASRTLALAKNAGAGAIAHEWWHAFDHYICKHMFTTTSAHGFASSYWLSNIQKKAHPLNTILSDFYQTCLLDVTANNPSVYFNEAVHLDKQYNQLYFSKPEELTARAFEACIAYHASIQNAFLVSGIINSDLEKAGGFPCASLRAQLSQHVFNYFNVLGAALHHRRD